MALIDNRGDAAVSGQLALPGVRMRLGSRPSAAAGAQLCEIVDLLAVPEPAWADLAGRAAEANAFFHPAWARAVARHAEGHAGSRALLVWDGPTRTRLLALLPVMPAWRALKLPLPLLVAWQAYAPLTTPLLDAERIDEAARGLLAAATRAGALAVLLPRLSQAGVAAQALRRAVAGGPAPRVTDAHQRALLDAAQEPDAALQTLGAKKLKELRRQRNRLADGGAVTFAMTADPAAAAAGLDAFLSLEAQGWKGARGTALAQKPGDAAFVREAVAGMMRAGQAQVATLASGDRIVGAGIVLRHRRRGYFFKIAYDETLAKMSPGVQLTLDITRSLCADSAIDSVDSIAVSDHPMIDHVWRDRLPVCDLLLPVRVSRPAFLAIAAVLAARRAAREFARTVVHRIRFLRGVRP
ncbi:MAG TPA: GNAT family N-acetyltransferase [Pseudolabrys sp.]|nr:GNAT family N-acetyltransferase [Pseudolabrys sp.]